MEKNLFYSYNFALVIVRHSKSGKFLCVEESKDRGWWIPGGKLEVGENFYEAAHREVWEEAKVKMEIKGVLRVEHSVEQNFARMRVIFYAESSEDNPKSVADKESVRAIWCNMDEILKLNTVKPYHRGSEIVNWPEYILNGGKIYPCSIFTDEKEEVELVK